MDATSTTLSAGPRSRRHHGRRVALVAGLLLAGLVVQVPRVGAANEVHLVAAGDFGARAATDTVLTAMAAAKPDAALALGDLAYRDAVPETAWCAYVKARVGEGFPFELISGNHESLDVNDGQINDFSACLPNQIPGVVGVYGREYYFDLPKAVQTPLVRVINASPNLTFEDGKWAYAAGDVHHAWVANAIDSARAAGIRWIVVTAHEPCQSVGAYSCPTAAKDFYSLLLTKKVDLVLHGHEHGYMRTKQLRSGTTGCPAVPVGTFDADCVADSDDAFAAGVGTVFATVGTGGTPLRDINAADTEEPYFAKYSGLNLNATYGMLDITATDSVLTAGFVPTSGAGMTDSFTITTGPPPANQAPTARFTATTSDLTATVDGSTSNDPDGTIDTYEWNYGDSATATGATPAPHAYAQAGTYTLTLTVTDNGGATDTTTRSVTVTAPPSPTLALDSFDRTVASGWGTSQNGGAWTVNVASDFSVGAGTAKMASPARSTRSAFLRSVSSSATDLTMTVSSDKLSTGGGLYLSVAGRSIVGAGDYRAKYVLRSDGKVVVSLVRTSSSGVDTTLANGVIVANLTYAAGSQIALRVQVTGTSPTTIRARAWVAGSSEPTAWALSTTDSTAGLQAAGSLGIVGYLSSTATNSPITLAVDDLRAVTP